MNNSMIRYILGHVLKIEAVLLLLPCIVALIYREPSGVSFIITAILCGILGIFSSRQKPKSTVFYLKEGCIATAFS